MRARPTLGLFLLLFSIYNLNCRPIPAADSIGTALLPLRIVLDGKITLDPYVPALTAAYGTDSFLFHADDGHYYSWYPILQSIAISPCYLPLLLFPTVRELPPDLTFLLARVMEKIMASLIAAASVACFFLLVRRLAGPSKALLLACVYGLATNTWATSSQALWQHGASQLGIVLSLLSLRMFLDGGRSRWSAAGAASFAALTPWLRPTDVLFYLASFAVLAMLRRRTALPICYAVAGALFGGALLAYNLAIFHRAGGAYPNLLHGDILTGLAGIALSPSRGLFIYSPILLFSLAGIARWLTSPPQRGRELYAVSALFALAHVLVCAKWSAWWGGDCYGPRVLADALPCLVLLILPALDWVRASRPRQIAFAAALSFSVFVQLVGAFCYPTGFVKPEPLWDWSCCPIALNARAGPATAPYRALAMWADQLAHGKKPDWRGAGLNFR